MNDATQTTTAPINTRPVLVAHVDEKFHASCSFTQGLCVADLSDQHNEPRIINMNQANSSTYRKAAKVWEQVENAQTFSEVWGILSKAGVKCHYYCAMD